MKRTEIKTKEPFEGLFPIDAHILKAVEDDMKANGYDPNFPVTVWKGACLDGHTRLKAAATGFNIVPVFIKDFPGEGEALQYQIHCQRDRRDKTDRNILRCVEVVDKRKDRGGDHKSRDFQESKTSNEVIESESQKSKGPTEPIDPERSAETTAKLLGTSPSKIKKIRTILDYGDDEIRTAVKTGEKSIHRAYVETQKKRKGRY